MTIQQDVLWFDVCVYDAAALVQEVQPCQHLGEQAERHLRTATQGFPLPPQPQHLGTAGVQVVDVLVLKKGGTDENDLQ